MTPLLKLVMVLGGDGDNNSIKRGIILRERL